MKTLEDESPPSGSIDLAPGARGPTPRERALQAARRLDHPNLVRLLDFGATDDTVFLVHELVRARSLATLVGEPQPWADVVEILAQIARALDHAHVRGVVHGRISPTNVLRVMGEADDRPLIRVSDFGTRAVADRLDAWAGAQPDGHPAFTAPEQIASLPIDGRTDVYALGALAFTLLSGEAPFTGARPVDVYEGHARRPVPRLAERCPDVPRDLVDLVHWMLEKAPDERCPSPRVVLELLLRGSTPPSHVSTPPSPSDEGLNVVARPAHEPPWPSAPPYEAFIAPATPPDGPQPAPSADETKLSRLWSRYGTVRGEAPGSAAFWVRTSEDLILGPFDHAELRRALEREREGALAPEVWISADQRRWASLEAFAAWTEQPDLAPGVAPSEVESAGLGQLFTAAARLTEERATGRLAVRLRGARGTTTWRAFLRRGEVVRFELADPQRTLPELAGRSGDVARADLPRDLARAINERKSLWEVWAEDGRPAVRSLRMRLLRTSCQALMALRVTGLSWLEGDPPWRGPIVAPSLTGLLLYAAQTGQPRARWLEALAPHLDRAPTAKQALFEQLAALAPDEDALAGLETLLSAPTLRVALEAGAEPAVIYTVVASRWVALGHGTAPPSRSEGPSE